MKPEPSLSEGSALRQELRMTPQRSVVHEVLQASFDHPTATEVFMRSKERMSGISLATVYNCLETLVEHGLIKQVNVDRASSRFCANLEEHVHFHCEGCGTVADAQALEPVEASRLWKLPAGGRVTRVDVAIRGFCPACASK